MTDDQGYGDFGFTGNLHENAAYRPARRSFDVFDELS